MEGNGIGSGGAQVRDDSVKRGLQVMAKEAAVIDLRFGLVELSGAVILPRSLRCVTRRIKTMRKRKPGRSARNDEV